MKYIKKNLPFSPRLDDPAEREAAFDRLLQFTMQTMGAAAMTRQMNLALYTYRGSQLFVSEEVSDDLSVSDVDMASEVSALPWPDYRMEVFFEDPHLGSMLATRTTSQELLDEVGEHTAASIGIITEEGHTTSQIYYEFIAAGKDGSLMSVKLPESQVDAYVRGNTDLPAQEGGPLLGSMNEGENEEIHELVLLFLKVLLFASCETHGFRRADGQPTRKQGGKAGVCDRPRTDRFVVEYLPSHREEKVREARAVGSGRAFLGRRGHFRTYKDERYKAMRGKRVLIYPVPAPDGTVPPRKKFIVRKPYRP